MTKRHIFLIQNYTDYNTNAENGRRPQPEKNDPISDPMQFGFYDDKFLVIAVFFKSFTRRFNART